MTERALAELIGRLGDADMAIRKGAAKDLATLKKKDVDEQTGLLLLRAAVARFPSAGQFLADTSSDLIKAAGQNPRAEYIVTIRELYADYGDAARTEALALLAAIATDEAVHAYAELLTAHGWPSNVFPRTVARLEEHPRSIDVVMPAFFSAAEVPEESYRAFHFLYVLSERGAVSESHWAEYGELVLSRWRRLLPTIEAAQQEAGIAWRWEESYLSVRSEAGLLLDLLGCISRDSDEIDRELCAAIELCDPYLRAFAAVAALRRGATFDRNALDSIAENHHARWIIGLGVRQLRRPELMPERHRTITAFAYANMVQWLTFETELGREPDEIELMAMHRRQKDRSAVEIFLFRFRTFEPHWAAENGWIAGVAGPFSLEGDFVGGGWLTFSTFTPWEAKSPIEHEADLRAAIDGEH